MQKARRKSRIYSARELNKADNKTVQLTLLYARAPINLESGIRRKSFGLDPTRLVNYLRARILGYWRAHAQNALGRIFRFFSLHEMPVHSFASRSSLDTPEAVSSPMNHLQTPSSSHLHRLRRHRILRIFSFSSSPRLRSSETSQ